MLRIDRVEHRIVQVHPCTGEGVRIPEMQGMQVKSTEYLNGAISWIRGLMVRSRRAR